MPTIIIKPSDKFKKNFDKTANKVAREVHQLMKEKQMKSISDAPEEMKDIFEEVWKVVFANRSQLLGDRQIAEHFFMTGVSSAKVLYGLMLNKTKRTIEEFCFSPQGIILVKSSDGKLFMVQGFEPSGSPRWMPYPDLPQD